MTRTAAESTISFAFEDYKDLGQFVSKMYLSKVLSSQAHAAFQKQLKSFVIANAGTGSFKEVQGVSIWLPLSPWTYDTHRERYSRLTFNDDSAWLDAITTLIK
jgi:hypothetical protein